MFLENFPLYNIKKHLAIIFIMLFGREFEIVYMSHRLLFNYSISMFLFS
jgi:hypothetical protein